MVGLHDRGVTVIAETVRIEAEAAQLVVVEEGVVHNRTPSPRFDAIDQAEDTRKCDLFDTAPIRGA